MNAKQLVAVSYHYRENKQPRNEDFTNKISADRQTERKRS
jgi:hypothetical protein